MTQEHLPASGLAQALATQRFSGLLQIALVFGVAGLVLAAGRPFVGDSPLKFQAMVWIANVCMLGAVWLGLRVRGEDWRRIGLGPGAFTGRALWSTL